MQRCAARAPAPRSLGACLRLGAPRPLTPRAAPLALSLRCTRSYSTARAACPRSSALARPFPPPAALLAPHTTHASRAPAPSPTRIRGLALAAATAPANRHLLRRVGRFVALLVLLLIALVLALVPEVSQRTASSLHTAVRFSRAVAAATLISLDYKWSLYGLSDAQREVAIHDVHLRSARRLRRLFERNAGIFIKAGQHIAVRPRPRPPPLTRPRRSTTSCRRSTRPPCACSRTARRTCR